MTILRLLAAKSLMLVGCALLVAALVGARTLHVPAWLAVAGPLLVLGVNLAAAIALHPSLRRGGLGLFHVALLALMVVAAAGRLMHLDGRIELAEGSPFEAADVDVQSRGPLHPDALQAIRFVQGPYTTDYAPRVKRGHTRSEIVLPSAAPGAAETRTVGDDAPLVVEGYRLYTTHNKGFAPVVTWTPDGAAPMTGALHMPSYPLFEYKQQLDWTPPHGAPLRLWLKLDTPLEESDAWRLEPARAKAALVVHAEGQRVELAPGETLRLAGGALRYERLIGWMGYRVFYDPTLRWLLVLAGVAVLGLACHVVARLGVRVPSPGARGKGALA